MRKSLLKIVHCAQTVLFNDITPGSRHIEHRYNTLSLIKKELMNSFLIDTVLQIYVYNKFLDIMKYFHSRCEFVGMRFKCIIYM